MLTHSAATPVLLGLAAAFVWGAADFAGGLAARRGRVGRVVFVAHGCSAVLLGVLTLIFRPAPLPGVVVAWGLASGVSGGVALMLFYEALALGEMGLSAALAGVLTAALPVVVAIVRDGRPGAWQLAGFAVAAGAIGLIGWAPGETMRPRTFLLATVAGLGFGLQLVAIHLVSQHGSILQGLLLSRTGAATAGGAAMLLAALRGQGVLPNATRSDPRSQESKASRGRSALLPATDRVPGQEHEPAPALEARAGAVGHLARLPRPAPDIRSRHGALATFLVLAALAGLLDTGGNGLYMSAALIGRLDVAAVLASLYPGATILLAAWLLKERTTPLQAAGMALALVAVALISL